VLCDTWNWNDDNDTGSGIAILDTTAIPEMRIAQCNSNVVQNSPASADVTFWLSIGCLFESVSKSKKKSQMRLERLAFYASVLAGLEVAMVTLALAVVHSLAVADVKTVSSEISVGHSWLLVVEFEIIIAITHEWPWQIIRTTLSKPSNLLQLQITIIPV